MYGVLPAQAAGANWNWFRPAMRTTILDEIVASKRREVAAARRRMPLEELEAQAAEAPPVRDFRAALAGPGPIQLIAEVKKASPSAKVIRADFDPVAIARTYQDAWRGVHQRADRRSLFPGASLVPGAGPGVGRDPLAAQGFPDRRVSGRRGPAGRRGCHPADRRDPRRRHDGGTPGASSGDGDGGPRRAPRRGQPTPRPGRGGRPRRDQQSRPPPASPPTSSTPSDSATRSRPGLCWSARAASGPAGTSSDSRPPASRPSSWASR